MLHLFAPLAALAAEPFRFHIQDETQSFDPVRSHLTVASWVLNLLHAPLMIYQDHKLSPYGAQSCDFKSPRLVECSLRKDWLWSDGTIVKADDIVLALRSVFSEKSPRANNFLEIKNAKKIISGVLSVDHLGVLSGRGKDGAYVQFQLEKPDAEFIYRLIDPLMSPRRATPDFAAGTLTSGPYVFSRRVPGRSLTFKNNDKFFVHEPRPEIEVLIVDSDETAVSMFEKGILNFHRRIPPEAVGQFEKRPGFFYQTVLRFDYVGFGPALAAQKDLRESMAASVASQSKDYQKLFGTGPAGCVILSKDVLPMPVCLDDKTQTKVTPRPATPLMLEVSSQGGVTVVRQAELFRAGWKKNLNLDVEIKSVELGQLENELRQRPPTLFRRGVNLERPTCLAALELFGSGSPDNFVGLKDPKYDAIITQMRSLISASQRSALCAEGLKRLLASHRVIPLSQTFYPMVSDQKFDGFRLNELNQLDLSHLKPMRPKSE